MCVFRKDVSTQVSTLSVCRKVASHAGQRPSFQSTIHVKNAYLPHRGFIWTLFVFSRERCVSTRSSWSRCVSTRQRRPCWPAAPLTTSGSCKETKGSKTRTLRRVETPTAQWTQGIPGGGVWELVSVIPFLKNIVCDWPHGLFFWI